MLSKEASRPCVVVIDDEPQIRRLLRISLETKGYEVFEAADGHQGLQEVAMQDPDVVVLDLGLPDMDGIEVLERLRQSSSVPVLVLSIRSEMQDKITALRRGADDYMTKPFSTAALVSRLKVLQGLAQFPTENTIFTSGPLTVDLALRTVSVLDRPLKLNWTEYALMGLLVRHAGQTLTSAQIIEVIWGSADPEKIRFLPAYMTHLREKIEPFSTRPGLLLTEPRVGYRLNANFPPQADVETLQATGALMGHQ